MLLLRFGIALSVVQADRSCVMQVSTSAVHISSSQQQQTTTSSSAGRCGSVDRPWTLRAPTGQHIRVHLLDFTDDVDLLQQQQQQQHGGQPHSDDDDDDDDDDGTPGCRECGYVAETMTPATAARRQRTEVICGNRRRDKLVLESSSNDIHIVLNRPATNNSNFLLRFYGELAHFLAICTN